MNHNLFTSCLHTFPSSFCSLNPWLSHLLSSLFCVPWYLLCFATAFIISCVSLILLLSFLFLSFSSLLIPVPYHLPYSYILSVLSYSFIPYPSFFPFLFSPSLYVFLFPIFQSYFFPNFLPFVPPHVSSPPFSCLPICLSVLPKTLNAVMSVGSQVTGHSHTA